jgi:GNAT superfamily N-acetyltransferase
MHRAPVPRRRFPRASQPAPARRSTHVVTEASRARLTSGDGSIAIRPLRPCDGRLLRVVHQGLGPQSRIHRYLCPKPALTDRELAVLTAVDGWNRVALVAFSQPAASPIGVARYVRAEDVEVAETAIEVIDAWQRRGIGRLLVAELQLRAIEAGVRRFEWTALASNRAVAALSRDLHDPRRVYIGDGVIQCSAALRAPKRAERERDEDQQYRPRPRLLSSEAVPRAPARDTAPRRGAGRAR